MIAKIVYLLCALASAGCAGMLVRGYLTSRTRLILLASLCFAGLAINNVFLFVDLVVLPETNLSGNFWRNLIGAFSGGVLLVGLIWELT